MSRHHQILLLRIVLATALALTAASCGSDLPAEETGGRIQGTITYQGQAHQALGAPAVSVYAFASWPPSGPPHGSRTFEQPDFVGGTLDYELALLQSYEYVVLATLTDLDDPDGPYVAAGGAPDYCTFGRSPVGVMVDEPTQGLDIELFDNGGAEDPCGDPGQNVEPEPGKAAVAARVVAPGMDYTAGAQDSLSLALFTAWPAMGPPIRFKQLYGDQIDLPVVIIDNAVEPGQYAIMVCLDMGGDNFTCDGPGDLQSLLDGGNLVSMAEGDIVPVSMDLVSGAGERLPDLP